MARSTRGEKSPAIAYPAAGTAAIRWALLFVAVAAITSCTGGSPEPRKHARPRQGRVSNIAPKPASKVPPKPLPAPRHPVGAVLRPGEGGEERTVPWVVARLEPKLGPALKARCRAGKIAWPPARLTLLAFKRERRMELWGANATGSFALLKSYRILAASGGIGPKRREGDRQVPEGFYRLPELNPRSSYHLSIRVDYPNRDDIAHAGVARDDMGGDIYIHGSDVSIGCMALGDPAIEEVFLLAALVPEPSRRIIISPYDFRRSPGAHLPRSQQWVTDLYRRIIAELRAFPRRRG